MCVIFERHIIFPAFPQIFWSHGLRLSISLLHVCLLDPLSPDYCVLSECWGQFSKKGGGKGIESVFNFWKCINLLWKEILIFFLNKSWDWPDLDLEKCNDITRFRSKKITFSPASRLGRTASIEKQKEGTLQNSINRNIPKDPLPFIVSSHHHVGNGIYTKRRHGIRNYSEHIKWGIGVNSCFRISYNRSNLIVCHVFV